MRIKLLFLLSITIWLLMPPGIYAQPHASIPTTDILNNTYRLRVDTVHGTAFIGSLDSVEYVITAKHLLVDYASHSDTLLIYLNRPTGEVPYLAKVFYHEDDHDIAVLQLDSPPSVGFSYPVGGAITLGANAYFLGFPYNERFTTLYNGWKVPLIKSATLSGSVDWGGLPKLVLDGHNNPGFSGGPIIAYDNENKTNCIIGVVSGYYPQMNKVKNAKGEEIEDIISPENSGIIFATHSTFVEEIIRSIK